MAKNATSLDLPALFTKAGYELPTIDPSNLKAFQAKVQSELSKGADVEEAVAVALKKFGIRARKLTAAAVRVEDIPGGHYTAVDNGDGTWNILDVPVVGEMRKGEKDAPFDIGRDWHEAALRKALTRQGDGHWGAVHVNHHAEGVETAEAGMIRFRRVGTVMYQGSPMSAMYADLLRVPEDKFHLIDQGRLRYISVEIASWDEPEVASLAVMPDETPFFRLPMLTTGKKVKADPSVRVANLKKTPAIAFANAGDGAFILFNLGGDMTTPKKADKKINLTAKELETKERLEMLETLKAKLDGGDDGGEDGDGGDFMMKLFKYAKAQLKKMGAKMDDGDSDAGDSDMSNEGSSEGGAYGRNKQTTGGNEGPGKFGRPPVEQGDDSMDMKEAAKLSARLDGLEKDNAKLKADNEKREQDEKIKGAVAKAHDALKGYYLSADTKAKLQKFAEKDPSGELAMDFVTSYKSVASPDDLPEGERRPAAPAPLGNEPEAIAKLAAKGPEAVERGREIYREFVQAKQSQHIPATMEFDRYLDINLSLPALKVRK